MNSIFNNEWENLETPPTFSEGFTEGSIDGLLRAIRVVQLDITKESRKEVLIYQKDLLKRLDRMKNK